MPGVRGRGGTVAALLGPVLRGHPGRLIGSSFALVVLFGALLLRLPIARAGPGSASWLDSLFTATSATCVTGLVTVDTGSHWSPFGQAVILALIQVGGLGIMTLAAVVILLVTGGVGLRSRLVAASETRAARLADVRATVRRVVLFSLGFEAVAAVVLTIRFAVDLPFGSAAWHGVFHAVSAFNNAGFGLRPDNLVAYVDDPIVCGMIAAAIIVGGLGFPVVFELAARWRTPRRWSILTRITLVVTAALLAVGAVGFVVMEWTNPATLGPMGTPEKLLAGAFTGVQPRTAGFNSIDVAGMRPESWFLTDLLMFVGGGSAGTAGGIKVTTFGLLAVVLWAALRGDPSVHLGLRRVPATNQRQALAVALLGVGLVVASTVALLALSGADFDRALFEVTSAFATVGLSTGITAGLPAPAQLVLIALMFAGRVGPLTLFSALAARERASRVEWPEEGTLVG